MRGPGLGRLGFLGVGTMGNRMASNLLKQGYTLFVCDNNKEATAALQKQGAQVAESPAELGVTPGNQSLIIPPPDPLKENKPSFVIIDNSALTPKMDHSIIPIQVSALSSACFLVHSTLKTLT